MSLSASDLVRLPYTPDLTEAGILSTCRWLAGTSERLGTNPYALMREKIGQVAVELAFRRLLTQQQVSFQTLEQVPFTDPHQHNLSLAGHRLHLNTTLLTRRGQIRSLRAEPGELLEASTFVPLEQFMQAGQTNHDIYLFAFVLALTAVSQGDQTRIESRGQSHYHLCHPAGSWSRPNVWAPLQPMSLKSEADHPVTIELGGQNAERKFITERMQLLPSTRSLPDKGFHSLAYIHSLDRPSSRLGVSSARFPLAWSIAPTDWGNIWLYGLETWLAGWLTHAEYRHRAVILAAGQETFPYSRIREKSLCVPMQELRPLRELFGLMRPGTS